MTPRPQAARMRLADFSEGQRFSLEVEVTADDIDAFAALSGDYSPLHMDDAFARSRGFAGRVVHGALLGAYVSRSVGMHFPGENALVQILDLRFAAPAYAGDTLRVTLTVDHISKAANTVLLKVAIEHALSGAALVRGRVQVGLTGR